MEFLNNSKNYSLNRKTYINLRWIAVIGQLAAINIATFIFKDPEPNIIFFIFFMIIIFTHKENIIRLINKNESKIKF